MNKQQVRDRILEIGIVPVVRASSSEESMLAAEAVCAGGIPIVGLAMTVSGALKGPFPQIPLVPTGGVNLSTAGEFIEAGAAALGVGGELVQAEALKSGKTELIAENARRFVSAIQQARSRVNSANAAVSSRTR